MRLENMNIEMYTYVAGMSLNLAYASGKFPYPKFSSLGARSSPANTATTSSLFSS